MYSPYSQWSGPSYLGADAAPVKPAAPVFTIYDPPAWADAARSAAGGYPLAKLESAAAYQIRKAYVGAPLSDMMQAEDNAMFQRSALDDAGAYMRTAYWMAVAARIVGSRMLAARADLSLAAGKAAGLSSFVSKQFTGNVGLLYTNAAKAVRDYAAGNPAALAVASKLDALAAESQTAPVREASAIQTTSPFDDLRVGIMPSSVKIGLALAGGAALVYWLSRKKSAPKAAEGGA